MSLWSNSKPFVIDLDETLIRSDLLITCSRQSSILQDPEWRKIWLILIAALVLRALCVYFFAGEIDQEGGEYARLAQNLISGRGYVGLNTEGVQLIFPPLFPIIIAALSFVTGTVEVAGRVANIIFGAALMLPVYLIARRLFGSRIGFGAAALVAFHPYLVQFSATVYGEVVYLTFALTAVYAAMTAMDTPHWRTLVFCGVLYSFAYLIRPEALALVLVSTIFILVSAACRGRQRLRETAKIVWLMPLVFTLVAGPYIGWLSFQSGSLRFENKSIVNTVTQLRIQKGMSQSEADYKVDEELHPDGTYTQPNINIIEMPRLGIKEFLVVILSKATSVLQNSSAGTAGAAEFGSPALFALAVLGLFGRPWHRELALQQLHLISLLGLCGAATFFIYYSSSRFYIPFLVIFCIWASAGINRIAAWARQSAVAMEIDLRKQTFLGCVAGIIAIAAILLPSALVARSSLLTYRSTRPNKHLAQSLAASSGAMKIADTGAVFAFNAQADYVPLPYCSEETALRYLKKMNVTHIVVRQWFIADRPYLKKWMDLGVPESREVAFNTKTGEKVRVFELSKLE